MNALQLTNYINSIANFIACNYSNEEINLISTILVQLGDTLVTISTLNNFSHDNRVGTE